jgi:hypothetical protein
MYVFNREILSHQTSGWVGGIKSSLWIAYSTLQDQLRPVSKIAVRDVNIKVMIVFMVLWLFMLL